MSKLNSVRAGLELYVEPFDDEPEAWADVLRRASIASAAVRQHESRRPRLLAAAAFATATVFALAMSPVGSAIARSFGDFSAWLGGSPGEPASDTAQRAFDFENERTWARFPDEPELRRVIVARAGDGTFELFGFRSGDSLCLRLTAEGIPNEGATSGCAPMSELRSASAPALALHLDAGFGHQNVPRTEDGYVPPRASATFGIVADGVEAVELATSEGPVDAIVANNAFLALTLDPPSELRTTSLIVIGDGGERVSVPLAESPSGDYGPIAQPGIPPGPRSVERKLEGGSIGWLVGGEARGRSLAEAGIDPSALRLPTGNALIRFVRVVTPDPAANRHMALALVTVPESKAHLVPWLKGGLLCRFGFGGGLSGGGCSRLSDFFDRGPVNYSTSGSGGEQYLIVSGLASDDVAHLDLYLATGERPPVALRDNTFVAEVARTEFPARLVAYDEAGRVIGTEIMGHDPLSDPGPRPIRERQRVVARVVGVNGSRGVVRVGPSTAGTRCHRVTFQNGAGAGGCMAKGQESQLALGALSTGEDSFITGTVADGTAAIELRFRNGERIRVEVVEGVVAHPLTDAQVESGGPALAIALDRDGKEIGRQRLRRMGR